MYSLLGLAQFESWFLRWWWRSVKFLYRLKAGDLDSWLVFLAIVLLALSVYSLYRQLLTPTRGRSRADAEVMDWRFRGGD
jgi:hypothetical protein